MRRITCLIVSLLLNAFFAFSQTSGTQLPVLDYTDPKEYYIADIKVTGVKYLDTRALISLSGLAVGKKIKVPGDDMTRVLDKYWKHGLFSDVKLLTPKIEGDSIWLEIALKERPRLTKFTITGVKKGEVKDLTEKLAIKDGTQITDNLITIIVSTIQKHYREKGYWNCKVKMIQTKDTLSANKVFLVANITKGKKVKVASIEFEGNDQFTDKRLRRTFKKTHQKSINIFHATKFIEAEYKEDKNKLEEFYSKNGYRDYRFLSDSITVISENRIALKIKIHEGNQYHFRKITWIGNTKYSSDLLNSMLKMKAGDIYDVVSMEKRLFSDDDAVFLLYQDNGYLFSHIDPVETSIENDSVDIEMRVVEGPQATIKNIVISGNTKTNEHVARRELYTYPGQLYSRTDIVNSVRQLAQLGHFDPEKIVPQPIPNESDGTVDIQYKLEEKPNDQLELSGGWGGNMLVGTLGLRFNNFSARNIFNPKAWRPVPSGDGQSLSLRAQTNGSYYKAYSLSFTEPWLGGRKPNALSVDLYHTVQYPGKTSIYQTSSSSFKVTGMSVGLTRRLTWPDRNFSLSNSVSLQNYSLSNWSYGDFIFNDGTSKNLSFKTVFMRNTVDQPIYPRSGSQFALGLQITPPYSLLRKTEFWKLPIAQRHNLSDEEVYKREQAAKYKWIEYHKWTFKGTWYNELAKNLVLSFNSQLGYLGYFNTKLGNSPFEGFTLGGDGLAGYNLYGKETVGLRGYENESLTPLITSPYYNNGVLQYKTTAVANVYDKLTIELRYPITLQPQATIYGLVFVEGGNSWYNLKEFNPFMIKRSAGVGIRAYLAMFGLLGVDWGYGFDPVQGGTSPSRGQVHFVMGQQF
jgi:outer membrane protein insertion porin family